MFTKKKKKLFASRSLNANTDTVTEEKEITDTEFTEESKSDRSQEKAQYEEARQSTEEVPVNEPKIKDEKKTIDMMDDDYVDEFIQTETEEADDVDPENPLSGKSADDIRKKIKEEEKTQAESLTYKDFEMVADFLITAIDTGISTGLRIWAGDNTDAPYGIKEDKKKVLKGQLTLILIKYKQRFAIEFMFLFLLCTMYVTPFLNAKKFRKERKALKASTPKRNVFEKKEEASESKETFKPENNFKKNPVKRGFGRTPGRPRKA